VIRYPALIAALEDLDLDGLALASGVPTGTIRAILDGGIAPSLGVRFRLARALDANPADLFRTVSVFEGTSADLEPAYPPDRFVTDPAALRLIDRARA
jgi:hypothetical protein